MTIYYRHRSPADATPPWFQGWAPVHVDAAICHRDTAAGHVVGIGNPLTFNPSPRAEWADLDDGWQASLGADFDPRLLIRHSQRWADVVAVPDMQGREWAVPVILTGDGSRAFRVAYGGRDMLPRLTPEQTRCLDVATEARVAWVAEKARQAAGEDGTGVDMQIAARWALPVLAAANHIDERAIAELGLADDFLIVGAAAVATGLPLKR